MGGKPNVITSWGIQHVHYDFLYQKFESNKGRTHFFSHNFISHNNIKGLRFS